MIVDDEDYDRLVKIKWYYCKGYARGDIWNKEKNRKVIISAHQYIMKVPRGKEVHHVNHAKLDIRKENLQIVSKSEHIKIHKQIYPDLKPCEKCGTIFKANPKFRKTHKTCSPKCSILLGIETRQKGRLQRGSW